MTSLLTVAIVAGRPSKRSVSLRSSVIAFVCCSFLSLMSPLPVVDGDVTFISLKPQKGPRYGGTHVTIIMLNPDNYIPTEVYFGHYKVPVQDSNYHGSIIEVFTPDVSGDGDLDTSPQQVHVVFPDSNRFSVDTKFSFTYYPYPNIKSISPLQYIYTGGIQLTVVGEGLDISESPVLEVTTVGRSLVNSDFQTNSVKYQSICTNSTFNQMICVTPTLYIPPAISYFLDSIQPSYNDSDSIPEAMKTILSQGYVDNGNNNTMFVYIGLIFDGNVLYQNLSSQLQANGSMVLIPGPAIKQWNSSQTFSQWQEPVFEIPGQRLNFGCKHDDYRVYIEGLECKILNISSDNEIITISMPDTYSITQMPYLFPQVTCSGKTDLHLQVTVGYRWYDVACITPLNPCSSTPCHHGGSCSFGKKEKDFSVQCNCTDNFYGQYCDLGFPSVLDIFPTYGPLAGGTVLTITAEVPDQYFKPIGVFIGDTLVQFTISGSSDEKELIVETPASVYYESVLVKISFNWNDHLDNTLKTFNTTNSLKFTYLPNPIIYDIFPKEYLYTGGTTLTVNGSNLHSVSVPYVNVTMTAGWQDVGQLPTKYSASFTSFCDATSDTTMLCPFPVVDVPLDLLAFLNQQPYGMSGSTVNLSCSDQPYGSPLETSRTDVQFVVGFILDGLTLNYSSFDTVSVYPPPIICSNSTFIGLQSTTKIVGIWGKHLLRGVSISDYKVSIENLDSAFLTFSVFDTLIYLRLAKNATDSTNFVNWTDAADTCPPTFPLQIKVSVAGVDYYPGCATSGNGETFCADKYCANGATCTEFPTITCTCPPKYYGPRCRFESPVLSKLDPSFGYLSGGTLITISGMIRDYSVPKIVTFGPPVNVNFTTQDFISSGNDIVLRTPALPTNTTTSINIDVTFETIIAPLYWISTWKVAKMFTYWPNPDIESFFPRHHIVTGGTLIYFNGSNFNVSQDISMTIAVQTISQTLDPDQEDIPVAKLQTFPTTNCSLSNDRPTELICTMPVTQVPAEFYSLLGDEVDDDDPLEPRRRRKRSTTNDKVGEIEKEEDDVEDDKEDDEVGAELQFRKRRDLVVRNSLSTAVMTVYVLLQFDSYKINLSEVTALQGNATLVLHRPPTVYIPSDVITFFPQNNQQIEIEGVNLTIGSNWSYDTTIYLGESLILLANFSKRMARVIPNDDPTGMMSLVDLNLTSFANSCRADGQQLDLSWVNLSNVYILKLRIGFDFFPAGCVHYGYSLPQDDTVTIMGTYVGMAIGISAAIVLSFAACTKSGSSSSPES